MNPSNHAELARLLHEREGLHTELMMIEMRINELRGTTEKNSTSNYKKNTDFCKSPRLSQQFTRRPFWDKQAILEDFQNRERFFERLNGDK